MPAKELTETSCHPRYSCSKLLLIDATFLFGLVTECCSH